MDFVFEFEKNPFYFNKESNSIIAGAILREQ